LARTSEFGSIGMTNGRSAVAPVKELTGPAFICVAKATDQGKLF